MSRMSSVYHVAFGLLTGSLLAGCIPVYYAYPTVAHVPPVPTGCSPNEIRAFRVDVKDEEICADFPESDRYVLAPVALSRCGTVPRQTGVALDYGFIWNCIALIYDGHTHHTVLVRLYRPGWQTVEIKSWEKTGQVAWVEASDVVAQEKAVDDLLSTWQTDGRGQLDTRFDGHNARDPMPAAPPRNITVFRNLAPGSASGEHREVLRFAADEYDRLAARLGDAQEAHEQRARLAEKALWLRELAEK